MKYEDKKTGFKFTAVNGLPKENTVEAFEELFAANKAAEEGGLPEMPRNYGRFNMTGSDERRIKGWTANQMREYARAAIAADRASRQVANKAEVEQDKIDAERYRWLRNHGDKEGQPPVMLQGSWHGGSNGVGFNLDEAVDSLMGIATPPATTGASTAPNEDQWISRMQYDAEVDEWAIERDNLEAEIRALKGSVGASTVLTDERIKELWLAMNTSEYKDFARAIEREVAAQAGQQFESKSQLEKFTIPHVSTRGEVFVLWHDVVEQAGQAAVLGWTSVDDSLPDGKYCLATYQDRAGKLRIIRAMYVRQFEIEANGDECDSETNEANDMEYLKAGWYELIDNWGEYSSVHVSEGPVTHWMSLPPSPAKESK